MMHHLELMTNMRDLDHECSAYLAKDAAQLLVGVDYATVLLVLQLAALDVLPQLLRDLSSARKANSRF